MTYTLDQLVHVGAPILMRILLDVTQRRSVVRYGTVAAQIETTTKLGKVFPTHIGHVAGTLMNRIRNDYSKRVPPINALVVNDTGLPGDKVGWYLDKYGGRPLHYEEQTPEVRRQLLEPIRHEIYNFPSWAKVASSVFGVRKKIVVATLLGEQEQDGKARRAGFGGPAEGAEHKMLKEYVAKFPRKFGAPRDVKRGAVEHRLMSKDEVDVCFDGKSSALLVEVKSRRSLEADFERGVYQVVKYLAVQLAMDKAADTCRNVRAILVTEDAPSKTISNLAQKLDVEIRPLGRLPSIDRKLQV